MELIHVGWTDTKVLTIPSFNDFARPISGVIACQEFASLPIERQPSFNNGVRGSPNEHKKYVTPGLCKGRSLDHEATEH